MSQQWYVRTSKGHAGPFSSGQLRKLAARGKITPKSRLSLDQAKWFSASRVKGLVFAAFPLDSPTRHADAPTHTKAPAPKREGRAQQKKQTTGAAAGFLGAVMGAVYGFVMFGIFWLFVAINIWPFVLGLTFNSGKDPSQTPMGELASSISDFAFSSVALYAMGVFVAGGMIMGMAAGVQAANEEPGPNPTNRSSSKPQAATAPPEPVGTIACKSCDKLKVDDDLYRCPECRNLFCLDCLKDKVWGFWHGYKGNCPICGGLCDGRHILAYQADYQGSD